MLLSLAACASPDPEASLDSFREAALTDAGSDTGTDIGGDTDACVRPRPTPDGDYFCALSASLDREKPLYMALNFTLDGDELTVDAQALARDIDEDRETPMDNARDPVGDVLPQNVVTYGEQGTFRIEWPGIIVVGAANPLTYSDIGGNLILEGRFIDDDISHGAMSGEVTNPTFLPLAGSTFACQRTDDPSSVDPVYWDSTIEEIANPPDCL
jgi:hypothetical protein